MGVQSKVLKCGYRQCLACNNNHMALFSNFLETLTPVPWRSVFEHRGRLRRFLIRIAVAVTGYLSFEEVICSLVVARRVAALVRKSGLLFTSLYLKQCAVHLQQYYAGSTIRVGKSAVNVSLSRQGIPSIIPSHHRHCIARRGDRGHHLVRLYLSWFSLCRIVKLAKKPSKSTFSSITSFSFNTSRRVAVYGELKNVWSRLQPLYMPWLPTIPLITGLSWADIE